MNMLDKIDLLMREKSIKNKMQLAQRAGIPYSTLTSMFSKGYEKVKLPTVQALCDVLGCSLDYLCNDSVLDPNYGKTDYTASLARLSPQESALLADYQSLCEKGRSYIRQTMLLAKQAFAADDAVALRIASRSGQTLETTLSKEKADAALLERQRLLEEDNQSDL